MKEKEKARLTAFLTESNAIEGEGPPNATQVEAAAQFLELERFSLAHLVSIAQLIGGPKAILRDKMGMNVTIGGGSTVKGGPWMRNIIQSLCNDISTRSSDSWTHHNLFEQIHPFMDGNGRIGRLLWLWEYRLKYLKHSFLQTFYYQTLRECSALARPHLMAMESHFVKTEEKS